MFRHITNLLEETMKILYMLFAVMVMAIPPAKAEENRAMTVPEIYNFVSSTNSAVNSPNLNTASGFLNRTTAENARFENRVAVYNGGSPWVSAWYGQPTYSAYYRYPLSPYYSQASMRTLGKWDHINTLMHRKRMVPGYRAHMEITGTTVNPYGQSAIVDVDWKEYSLAYSPYQPSLATQAMNTNARCKMYLSKMGEHEIMLTRMDCNTNTNLPF